MAGTMTPRPPEIEQQLATTPTAERVNLAFLNPTTRDANAAYGIAKRANQLRVQTASVPWELPGGWMVSISPGIVSTPMAQQELGGPSGDSMRQMIAMSASSRLGTSEDIAAVVEFLVSPSASFITGTDLLVDGGVIAALNYANAVKSNDQHVTAATVVLVSRLTLERVT